MRARTFTVSCSRTWRDEQWITWMCVCCTFRAQSPMRMSTCDGCKDGFLYYILNSKLFLCVQIYSIKERTRLRPDATFNMSALRRTVDNILTRKFIYTVGKGNRVDRRSRSRCALVHLWNSYIAQ